VLSLAQARSLLCRQLGIERPDTMYGRGNTLAALRRRGLVVGAQPHAELTPKGERVCRLLERKRPADHAER
jgi:hypothetical protein